MRIVSIDLARNWTIQFCSMRCEADMNQRPLGFSMYAFDTYMPASVIYLHLCTEVTEIGVIEDARMQCIVAYVSIILCSV